MTGAGALAAGAAALALVGMGVLVAGAAPPPGARPELREFFRGLMRPDTGTSCCDESDCRVTRSRAGANGWQAMNQLGEWVDVPEGKIIRDRANQTGEAILCWLPGTGVLCFMPPTGV